MVNDLFLMAIEPLLSNNWQATAENYLSASGYSTLRNKNQVVVWKEINFYRNIKYADAYSVERLWLAPKRCAQSIRSKRIYFSGNSDLPDKRQEYIICRDFKNQHHIIRCLKEADPNYKAVLVKVEELIMEDDDIYSISIHDRKLSINDQRLSQIYNECGFDQVPDNFTIYICPLEGVLGEYIKVIEEKLTRALKNKNITCVVNAINKEIILKNLADIKEDNLKLKSGFLFYFILPSRNKEVTQDTLELFNELEALQIPFRRAYSDDPFDYSIPDQLPSLLMAAGGRPHCSLISFNGSPVWTIGVDMGHSFSGQYTNLALSLVDPGGLHIKTWLSRQHLDETIKPALFAKMLGYCKEEVLKHESSPSVVIFRDGRYFENDEILISKEIFADRISIFEYRKRGNPQVFKMSDQDEPIFMDKPYAVIIPNANTIFLTPLEKQKAKSLPRVAKITWKNNWNGLQMQPKDVAELIFNSSRAPGLGLWPRHLPACIYWADGIATTSQVDLRFRGQRVCKL